MVTASRNWVCVRPATYESAEEAKVLLSYFSGRQGVLENTVFALLDSKGKMISFRAGRSPSMVYDSPQEFAAALLEHGKAPKKRETRALPVVANLRLGLNVAACDSIPLIVAYGSDEKAREKLRDRLAAAAWHDELVGEAHYVVSSKEELEANEALSEWTGSSKSGILVLDPDDYGREAELLSKVSASANSREFVKQLTKALNLHQPVVRDHREHIRNAKRKGIRWEGEIETTDPTEKRRKRERRG